MIGDVIIADNVTSVAFPASVKTTVLLEVEDAAFDVHFTGPTNRTGNLTISLETPTMQSEELGIAFPSDNPSDDFFQFGVPNIFPGAVAAGLWTVTFLASPDPAGWSSSLFDLLISPDQCVSTTTTTTIAVYPLPLGEAENSTGLGRNIDLLANANLTILLQVDEYCGAPAGCCVQDDPGSVYVVVTFTDATGLGNLTVSLETPDMQSQEIGVALLGIVFLLHQRYLSGGADSFWWMLVILARENDDSFFCRRLFSPELQASRQKLSAQNFREVG